MHPACTRLQPDMRGRPPSLFSMRCARRCAASRSKDISDHVGPPHLVQGGSPSRMSPLRSCHTLLSAGQTASRNRAACRRPHESGFGRKLAGSWLPVCPGCPRPYNLLSKREKSGRSFPHMPAILLPATSVWAVSGYSVLRRSLGISSTLTRHTSTLLAADAVFSRAGERARKSPRHGAAAAYHPLPCAGSRSRLAFQLLVLHVGASRALSRDWRARPDSLDLHCLLGGISPLPSPDAKKPTHAKTFFFLFLRCARPPAALLPPARPFWAIFCLLVASPLLPPVPAR